MKIAIAGYGIEGESSLKYFSSDLSNDITVVDEKQPTLPVPNGVKTVISNGSMANLYGYDLIIRTPSLAPSKIKTDGKIWSATNEFFSKCPAQIIGVTGTKGKGTICSLTASLLTAGGKNVWLVGNIGNPALDVLKDIQPEDIVVYELSSFQLWDLELSPHIAVVSPIEPEHLDIHSHLNDYLNAKMNVRIHQDAEDICVYHPTNRYSEQIAKASEAGKILRYGVKDDGGVYVRDVAFYVNEQEICSIKNLQLVGPHNIENGCAALTVANMYGISYGHLCDGLSNFKGLPHRLEFVREVDEVKYYNDSYSSSVPAAVAAIKSFTEPEVLIIGGIDRGGDFAELRDAIERQSNVKTVILVGEIRQKLAELLRGINNVEVITTDFKDMKSLVQLAKDQAQKGDIVILTPGCASFDMFKDFNDRGDQFRDEVNKL